MIHTSPATLESFLLAQLSGQSGAGIVDLCLDHKLIAELYPGKLTSLEGLQHFPDLKVLSVAMQSLQSADGIQSLQSLVELDLSQNEIANLEGLRHLQNLQRLNLSHNEISDLGALQQLTQLVDLNLSFNAVNDLAPLADLCRLEVLALNGNRNIKSLVGLSNSISQLHLRQCFVGEYTYLEQLNKLEVLSLSPASLKGLECLTSLPLLHTLNLSARRMYAGIHVPQMPALRHLRIQKASQIVAVDGLQGLPNLETLEISNSLLETPPYLGHNKHLKVLDLSFSPLKSLEGIADLPALERLIVRETALSFSTIEQLRRGCPDLEIEE
jgi:internalin A